MGLSIYAISNIKLSGNIINDEPTDEDINVYPGTFNRIAGLEVGLYRETDESRQHDFSAGPYSTYNWFRRNLSTAIFSAATFAAASETIFASTAAFSAATLAAASAITFAAASATAFVYDEQARTHRI